MSADEAEAAEREESDHDRLRQLFDALLDRLLIEVANPAAKASVLEVARAFLRQCGVSPNRATDLRAGLASLKDLPFSS